MNALRSLTKMTLALLIGLGLITGCSSTDNGSSQVHSSAYYGVGFYDPWYYGYDYPPDVIVKPPPEGLGPRPEHPIALPPPAEMAPRPEQPIARPSPAPAPRPMPSIPSAPRPMPVPAGRR